MDIGTVRSVDINEEMRDSYLDYAMSVIVARALPDARDGRNPVEEAAQAGGDGRIDFLIDHFDDSCDPLFIDFSKQRKVKIP